MTTNQYEVMNVEGGRHVKMWTRGVPVEQEAKEQLANTARMPFIFKHVAAMPDVHLGIGATVGSVVATKGAIIPAAVGVDIGCGMMAVQTSAKGDRPAGVAQRGALRIERAVPHGFATIQGRSLQGGVVGHTELRIYPVACACRSSRVDRSQGPRLKVEDPAIPVGNARGRQPLHRGLPGYRADGVGDVAFRIAWDR